MSGDTGTQFAGLSPTERVLAAADVHMSGCDEPNLFDCDDCLARLRRMRQHITALVEAGLLVQS